MGERELEILGDQLADVRTLDVLGLLDLDDAENLDIACQYFCLFHADSIRSVLTENHRLFGLV